MPSGSKLDAIAFKTFLLVNFSSILISFNSIISASFEVSHEMPNIFTKSDLLPKCVFTILKLLQNS
ncbi:unnamed protein product [Meloidogyne enterolobii]|uniref:Uncharacterized protein n=1 Tax=Meloidogyne enterolobii TaxID=390850 RepID=A0ACB0Z1P1_MELEN